MDRTPQGRAEENSRPAHSAGQTCGDAQAVVTWPVLEDLAEPIPFLRFPWAIATGVGHRSGTAARSVGQTGSLRGGRLPPSSAKVPVGRLPIVRSLPSCPTTAPSTVRTLYARPPAKLPRNRADVHFYVAHPIATSAATARNSSIPVGQDVILRRVGNPLERRLPTGAQLAKLPHKSTSACGRGTSSLARSYVAPKLGDDNLYQRCRMIWAAERNCFAHENCRLSAIGRS